MDINNTEQNLQKQNIGQQNTLQKTPSSPKYQNPLSRSIFIGCFAFVVIISVIMGTIGYNLFQDKMMQQYQSHLTDIINLVKDRIDIEDLKTCIETGEESEEYKELIVFLDQVRQNYSLDHIVLSTPIKEGDTYDVIQVASGLYPEERNGQNLKDFSVPLLGDRMGDHFAPEFLPVVYEQLQNCHEIQFNESENDFGSTYVAALGLYDDEGNPVTLITSGLSLEFIDATMKQYRNILFSATVILCIVFLVIMLSWFRKRIILPINQIETAARDFDEKSKSQKNPDALVLDLPEIHTGDELESLSDTLSSMSYNMKKYVEELLESAVKMDKLAHDLDESKQQAVVLSKMAIKDGLTGIRNKMGYNEEVERTVSDLENGNTRFGVAMIDLNYLKRINDTYGHEKGDQAIINLCHFVCVTFAHSPVFRIGGDEFAVILKNSDYDNVGVLVKAFNDEMEKLSNKDSLKEWQRISASIGYAIYDEKLDDGYDSVFARADKAMYDRKKEMKGLRED